MTLIFANCHQKVWKSPVFFINLQRLTNIITNKLKTEDTTMKRQKMYDEESYELDNQYNEEERDYSRGDSSIWYN